MVSNRCQHRDEAVDPMCQRKNTELIEDVLSVGDRGKQPVEVLLVDTLREKRDDSQKFPGIGAEFLECRGGKGEFYGRCEALIAVRPKYLRPVCVPLRGQLLVIPHVLRCRGGE